MSLSSRGAFDLLIFPVPQHDLLTQTARCGHLLKNYTQPEGERLHVR